MLRINVGLSRKLSQDYNSRGFSLNIDGEFPLRAGKQPLGSPSERFCDNDVAP